MNLSLKKVLITGSAGFIGFHTALALKARSDEVIGFDNFNDYYDVRLKRARAEILKKQGLSIIEGDICNRALLTKAIDDHGTTHVLHLAAQAGVRYSITNPEAYIHSNIEGFTSLLEVLKERPSIKLCYASSSSVYGLNRKVPYSVDDPTDQQASFYGVTKKANELMARTYKHLYKINSVGLRYFTVYGPWGRPDMALFLFADAILKDRPIDIFNHGQMRRDFTYIDDIVAGTVAAIDYEGDRPIFNLGHHQPVNLLNFIEILEEALGKKAHKRLLPMQPGDIPETFADIKESEEDLGFKPAVSIVEGVGRFVAWYREWIAKGGT